MHYLVFYEGVDNYAELRQPFLAPHRQYLRDAHARGDLVQAGALLNPGDGSVLVIKADAIDVAERFAANDPFVLNGVVKRWYVREWNTIIGPEATVPTIGT